MSNRRKLPNRTRTMKDSPDLGGGVIHPDALILAQDAQLAHVVHALLAAGQETIDCHSCGMDLPLAVMVDGHQMEEWCNILTAFRICPKHGLEALCPSCATSQGEHADEE